MGQWGFGNITSNVILACLVHLYGTPTIGEVNFTLCCLHNPMEHNVPIKVMMRDIKEI